MQKKIHRLRVEEMHAFTARIPLSLWQCLTVAAAAAATSINAELAAVLRRAYLNSRKIRNGKA